MDDLDDLLNDLEKSKGSTAGTPAPSAPQSRRVNSNALELDELNDLMNDLGAAGAKPAGKPAPAPAPAAGNSGSQRATAGGRRDIVSADMNKSMEDLDALMNSLNSADARASTAAPKPAAKPAPAPARASVQNEDLDALMASLDNPRGSMAPKAAAKPAGGPSRPVSGVPSAGDDLDALMADLDNPRKSTAAKAPAAPASRPVSKAPGADDLDALMADLESTNARKSTAPIAVAPAPAKPAPTVAKPTAKLPPADDLDALMADLDGPRKSTQPPAVKAAPANNRPVSGIAGGDDLDALMADLEGPRKSTQPPAAKPAPVAVAAAAPKAAPFAAKKPAPAQQAQDMEELDALMGSLNSDRKSVQVKPAAKPAAPAEDLDSLMGSLGQPNQKAPVTYTPTTTHQPPPKPGAKKPAGTPASGGDDISKLMNSLASQVAETGDGGNVSKGICAYCKKQILGEVVSAIGKVFHVDHWICQNCQEPLGTKTFFELDGAPYCEKCYSSTYCVKCGYCDEPILDRCITAIGKKWHINHFICTQCLQPFPRGVFFERDGKPYCETDFFEIYCFPVSDHQLLTSEGWMFYKDVQARMADVARESLLFASYDSRAKALVYEKPLEVVYNPPKAQDFVEFSDAAECERWSAHANKYGRVPGMKATGSLHHLSLLATPGHDMYVKQAREASGQRFNWTQEDYSKVKAGAIADGDATVAVRFLAHAANGIKGPSSAVDAAAHSDTLLPFMEVLNLFVAEQVTAFLELYGYWMGDGSLHGWTTSLMPTVMFNPRKDEDVKWIQARLDALNLVVEKDYDYHYNNSSEQYTFEIKRPDWAGYFNGQYGAKYQSASGCKFYVCADAGVAQEADEERYRAFYAAFQVGKQERLEPEATKSVKWFWYWVWWSTCNRDHARAILAGLCMADGDLPPNSKPDSSTIYTSSVRFRDEVQMLVLRAGGLSHFGLARAAGTATDADQWWVRYVTNPEGPKAGPIASMRRGDIKYARRTDASWCATMPSGFVIVRRAHRDDTNVVTRASLATIQGNCPKCAACDKPIRGDCVNALGQQWHQEHWGCTFCKKAFGSEPFFEIGGKPYCEQHYHQQSGALCQGCKKPIQGRCITALDKKWHPEHFTCSFCMNPLAGASYVEKQGKPYCKTCNQKLFG